jgi:hypothetical protein
MNVISLLASDRRIRFVSQITCAPYRPISTPKTASPRKTAR